jgi:hypothetical protein
MITEVFRFSEMELIYFIKLIELSQKVSPEAKTLCLQAARVLLNPPIVVSNN